MKTAIRYLLLQLPGWCVVAAVLVALCHWMELPIAVATALFLLWVVKDALMFPVVRKSYEAGTSPADHLIGARGIASQRLDPRGYVRVRGELWRAELVPGADPVPEGAEVVVRTVRGFTLIVGAEHGS